MRESEFETMGHKAGLGIRAGVVLVAFLCMSLAHGQDYDPDDEDALPPAAIPHPYPHPPMIYDPVGRLPPIDPEFSAPRGRDGDALRSGELYLERLPPRAIERRTLKPPFNGAPPRERSNARLMQKPPVEPPRVKPTVAEADRTEGRLRNAQSRSTGGPGDASGAKIKSAVTPVARNESPAAHSPTRPTNAPENLALTPVVVPITRPAARAAKPKSELDDVSGFINKGEGKVNLED